MASLPTPTSGTPFATCSGDHVSSSFPAAAMNAGVPGMSFRTFLGGPWFARFRITAACAASAS